jgi:hypothetical protein
MVTKGDLFDRDPDDLERCLLRHGRLDKAPDAARRRTLMSVGGAAAAGAGLTMTSISSGATAAPGAVPWLFAVKWVAVGLASGVVTLGVAGGSLHRSASRLQAPPSIVAPSAVTTASRIMQTNATGTNPPDETVDDATRGAPEATERTTMGAQLASEALQGPAKMQQRTPASTAIPTMIPNAESSLERELRFLEDARRDLDTNAATRALTALDRYAETFPAGRMGIEASALRIETLLALGRREPAQTLARSFLASYPRSPAAIRVRRLVGDASKGESNATP